MMSLGLAHWTRHALLVGVVAHRHCTDLDMGDRSGGTSDFPDPIAT